MTVEDLKLALEGEDVENIVILESWNKNEERRLFIITDLDRNSGIVFTKLLGEEIK